MRLYTALRNIAASARAVQVVNIQIKIDN